MAQQYSNQFLHNAMEPLDSTEQVESPEDLYATVTSGENEYFKIYPYVGKMVHVKSLRTIYVCASCPGSALTAVWRPVMADDGTAFFITTPAGEVFRISAARIDGQGRITVDIPSPTIPVINPPN